MVQRLGPLMRPGGSFLSLTYMASERVIPGYGGGMSSAKAALESDTRVLAFEAGRKWGHRVNTHLRRAARLARRERDRLHRADDRVRAGELAAPEALTAEEVGATAAFLAQPARAAASPARRSTSTRATTRWAWRCKTELRGKRDAGKRGGKAKRPTCQLTNPEALPAPRVAQMLGHLIGGLIDHDGRCECRCPWSSRPPRCRPASPHRSG